MATYDLTQTIPSLCQAGDILNCPYSGNKVTITLFQGEYKLECWGAEGGIAYSNTYQGGKGGYSNGILTLSNTTTLHLYAGGAPPTNSANGGFNGGGKSNYPGDGGGGGSDIRIGTDSYYARVIVAGGGGGGDYGTGISPMGGGTDGGGTQPGHQTPLSASVYVTPGQFGYAPDCVMQSSYPTGGSGGGWYGGGTGSGYSDGYYGNGGGSGYVYNSSTMINYPSGCLLTSEYYLADSSTVAGNTTFKSPAGTNETGHTSNGYVRITVISTVTPITPPSITVANASKAYTGSALSPTVTGYDSNTMNRTGTTSAIMPGTYLIYYTPKSGYIWSDGTLDEKIITWSITSDFSILTPYIYDGTSFQKVDAWIYDSTL